MRHVCTGHGTRLAARYECTEASSCPLEEKNALELLGHLSSPSLLWFMCTHVSNVCLGDRREDPSGLGSHVLLRVGAGNQAQPQKLWECRKPSKPLNHLSSSTQNHF